MRIGLFATVTAALAFIAGKSGADATATQITVGNSSDTGIDQTLGNYTDVSKSVELEENFEAKVKRKSKKNIKKSMEFVDEGFEQPTAVARLLAGEIVKCQNALIALDRSGTQASMYTAARAGVVGIIDEMFTVAPQNQLPFVGVFSYSSYGRMDVAPTNVASVVLPGTANIAHSGGGTLLQTALALILAQLSANPELIGDLLFIPIFSDFLDDNEDGTMSIVNQIHALAPGKIQFITVGVDGGSGVRHSLMEKITDNKTQFMKVFPAVDLVNHKQEIANLICPVVVTAAPIPAAATPTPKTSAPSVTPTGAPTAKPIDRPEEAAAVLAAPFALLCLRKRRKPAEEEKLEQEIDPESLEVVKKGTTTTTQEEEFEDERPNAERDTFDPTQHQHAGQPHLKTYYDIPLTSGGRSVMAPTDTQRGFKGTKGQYTPEVQEKTPGEKVVQTKVEPYNDVAPFNGNHYEAIGFLSFPIAIRDTLAKQGVINEDRGQGLRWLATRFPFELNVTPLVNGIYWVGEKTYINSVLRKTGVAAGADKVDQFLGELWDKSVKYGVGAPILAGTAVVAAGAAALGFKKKDQRTIQEIDPIDPKDSVKESSVAKIDTRTATANAASTRPINPVHAAEEDRINMARKAAQAAIERRQLDSKASELLPMPAKPAKKPPVLSGQSSAFSHKPTQSATEHDRPKPPVPPRPPKS